MQRKGQISHTPAQARLRLVADVRRRARRAALLPATALLVLGLVIAARGTVMEAWPHPGLPWLAWLALFVLARLALVRRVHSRGVQVSPRLRMLRAAAAVLAVAIAIVTGASALIPAVAAITAFAAFLSGLPAVGLAALLAGGLSEALVLEGGRPGIGLIVFGLGLAAIAISVHDS